MSEPPADYTLLEQGRLVAYLWRREGGGALRRASAQDPTPLAELAFAEIHCFDRKWERTLTQIARESEDLAALLYSCGVAGLELQTGEQRPRSGHRRF